jgi:transcriptional regulator with XRE-family HTH domain
MIDIYTERKKLGLTQKQFADEIGVSYQTVQNWEKGGKIPEARLKMLKSFLNNSKQIEFNDSKQKLKSEIKEVGFDEFMEAEYLPVTAQAGYLAGLEDNHPIQLKKMLVPKEFEKGFYKVIEIEGDSMNDGTPRSICDGDKLLLKQIEGGDYLQKTLPYRNNLFIIVSREGIVCKQIVEQDIERGCIICHSFNPLHKDYEICFEDIIQLFYVKKLVERKIKF